MRRRGVREKLVGDARMYDRRKSPVVVAPVEAVTLAAWGLTEDAKPPSKYESGDLLVLWLGETVWARDRLVRLRCGAGSW
jgi:hypothetical protein